jgi:transposase
MMARNGHRGRYTNKFKQQVVAETFEPGASVAGVARKHDLNGNMLFGWRKDPRVVPAARAHVIFVR